MHVADTPTAPSGLLRLPVMLPSLQEVLTAYSTVFGAQRAEDLKAAPGKILI